MNQEELKENLHYDPITGIFTWIKTNGPLLAGTQAGYLHTHRGGYINIGFKGKNYKAHRLAFLYMTGSIPEQVDHIDHNRSNNVWSNLRAADGHINQKNCAMSKNNKSGYTGVSWDNRQCKWVAQIGHNSKAICLGRYDKIEDAIKARKEAEKLFEYHANAGLPLGVSPSYQKQLAYEYKLENVVKPALFKFLQGVPFKELMLEYSVSKNLLDWMRQTAFELGLLDDFIAVQKSNKRTSCLKAGATISKSVNKLDLNGNFLSTYPSVIEAARDCGINQGNISNVLNGRSRTSGGYKWEYA